MTRTAPTVVVAASEDGFEDQLTTIRRARIKLSDLQSEVAAHEQAVRDAEVNARAHIDFLTTQGGHDRRDLEEELRQSLQFDYAVAYRGRRSTEP